MLASYFMPKASPTRSTPDNIATIMGVFQLILGTHFSPWNPHLGSAFGILPPTHSNCLFSLKYLKSYEESFVPESNIEYDVRVRRIQRTGKSCDLFIMY